MNDPKTATDAFSEHVGSLIGQLAFVLDGNRNTVCLAALGSMLRFLLIEEEREEGDGSPNPRTELCEDLRVMILGLRESMTQSEVIH